MATSAASFSATSAQCAMSILDAWNEGNFTRLCSELDHSVEFSGVDTRATAESERRELLGEVAAHLRRTLDPAFPEARRPERTEADLFLLTHLIQSRCF